MIEVRRETLLDFFDDFAACRAEFLIHDDGFRTRRYTYAEVSRQAQAFAQRLAREGIGANDKVIFFGENRPEWIVALWGCLLAGAVAVPIDYRSPLEFLERVREKVHAKLILAGDEAPRPAESGALVWPFSTLGGECAGPAVRFAARAETLAEIIFTSGATAEPKGVTHHARQRAGEHRSGGARGL